MANPDVLHRTRTALAQAAQADLQDRTQALDLLSHAIALIWRCHPEAPLMGALQLERRLREPVEGWLQNDIRGAATGPLIYDERLSEFAEHWLE